MMLNRYNTLTILIIAIFLIPISSLSASETVEWKILKTLKLEATPIDVAVSADGRRIFVLTEQGKIFVYSGNVAKEATIEVGAHVNKIQVSPKGDLIFSNSRQNKTVQVIAVDYIQNIDVSQSPFKGPVNAPVVIAVFDDFQ